MLVRKYLSTFAQNNHTLRRWIYGLGRVRSEGMYGFVKLYLKQGDRILDIGSGTCNMVELIVDDGFKVVPLDVEDLSFVDGIRPLIYNGGRIPFGNKEFDTALILTVLHHTPDPEKILREASRVAKRIIIMEDVYDSVLMKWATFLMDSVVNFEFFGHPHSNKSDFEWKETFKKLKLKLVHARYSMFWGIFRSATYCVIH